jgi:hypothetical protein
LGCKTGMCYRRCSATKRVGRDMSAVIGTSGTAKSLADGDKNEVENAWPVFMRDASNRRIRNDHRS